jgi:hypothetical protein
MGHDNRPILIIPWSEAKLDFSADALSLYQGIGYLSVVRQFNRKGLLDTFRLFFISAKYGLVPSEKVIAPYEQKMTHQRAENLSKSKEFLEQSSLDLSDSDKNADVFVVVPKLYAGVAKALLNNAGFLNINTPPKGSGIGSQRGYLKKILQSSLKVQPQLLSGLMHYLVDNSSLGSVDILVSVGDKFRPWINNCPDTFNPKFDITRTVTQLVQIKNNDKHISGVVDERGVYWPTIHVFLGIHEDQREHLKKNSLKGDDKPIVISLG